MALLSDEFQTYQMLLSLAKHDSPVNTFNIGNLITLKDNVSEDDLYNSVHEFRKRHYSAHRMTLAVQARLPIEILQAYVLDCFGNIPSNNLPPDDFTQFKSVFDTPEFAKIYYVEPSNEATRIALTWSLPSLLNKYKTKPDVYLAWLLRDEGKGSLLSLLRKKLEIELTDEGLKHLYEIIEYVFSYIKMLRELGPQKRLYQEIQCIKDTLFKFADEELSRNFVEVLCKYMQLYPPEDYITGPKLFFEYDAETIKSVLNLLIPNKMNVMVFCKNPPQGFCFDLTEKWFGIKHTVQDIPPEWLEKWQNVKPHPQLSVPPPNQFITKDFTIVKEDSDNPQYPEKVLENEHVELWFRKDQKFKMPNAYYYLCLINPLVQESVFTVILKDFLIDLLNYQLREEIYPARQAELYSTVESNEKGIILTVSGYNEKLHVLFDLITKHLVNFNSNLTEQVFLVRKHELTKNYYNAILSPSDLNHNIRSNILANDDYLMVDKYNAISSITFQNMQQFGKDFLSELYLKVLVQGNLYKEDAINVVNNFISALQYKPLGPNSFPQFRVIELPKGESLCKISSFNVKDSNSIITNYYQANPFSFRECVIAEIISLIINHHAYDTLRTKEQLGYSVGCFDSEIYGILGFIVSVNTQANKYSTAYVDGRIEEFMKQASQLLSHISSESFEETKADLIKTKQCIDIDLMQEAGRNFQYIIDDDYIFDQSQREIKAIEPLQIADVTKWWEDHCSPINYKKLSIQIVGFETSAEEGVSMDGSKLTMKFLEDDRNEEEGTKRCLVKNIQNFKETLSLYPPVVKKNL